MATRAQIGRIEHRIDQIAGNLGLRRRRLVVQIFQEADETKEAAMDGTLRNTP